MSARRGQNLVLFSLFGLLLTLMVMLCISIGVKAKEKMELQTLADTAAYSNAVATARTFNSVALMNRASIGHMVSISGVMSLISWSTYYRSNLEVTIEQFTQVQSVWSGMAAACCCKKCGCTAYCSCSQAGAAELSLLLTFLNVEKLRMFGLFMGMEGAAADEARSIKFAAEMMWLAGQVPALLQLRGALDDQRLTQALLQHGQVDNRSALELAAPETGDRVGLRELEDALAGNSVFAPVVAPVNAHAVHVAMGSRLHPFVTGRSLGLGGNAETLIADKLTEVIDPLNGSVSVRGSVGSGYFARKGQMPSHAAMTWLGTAAWADDHNAPALGTHTNYKGNRTCPWLREVIGGVWPDENFVRADSNGGFHRWHQGVETTGHRLGAFDIWPSFADYNFINVADEGNNFGQPKNFAVVQRDYRTRPDTFGLPGGADPWNLAFRFRATPAGASFDNRGMFLRTGEDISRQVAVATGIAYYHRAGHWSEAPNFFNPFWRAGLVHPDVDRDGKGSDLPDTIERIGYGAASDAYHGLRAGGFKGWQ